MIHQGGHKEIFVEDEELVMLMLLEAEGRSKEKIIGLIPCKDNKKCNIMCCLTKNDG